MARYLTEYEVDHELGGADEPRSMPDRLKGAAKYAAVGVMAGVMTGYSGLIPYGRYLGGKKQKPKTRAGRRRRRMEDARLGAAFGVLGGLLSILRD